VPIIFMVASMRSKSSPPVSLQALPVKALESHEQRFRCIPLSATIKAETCIARQEAFVQRPAYGSSSSIAKARLVGNLCERCGDCALGRDVAKQIRRVRAEAAE
jgi:hypothetical protein